MKKTNERIGNIISNKLKLYRLQDKISNFAASKTSKYEKDAIETIDKFNYKNITFDFDQWDMEKIGNDLNNLLLKWFKAGELS